MNELWVPQHVSETKRKNEGGSYFDDELETREHRDRTLQSEYLVMVKHLNARPDHKVYVGSSKDRFQLRKVLNHLYGIGAIGHHPDIKIDYGVPDGGIRITE